MATKVFPITSSASRAKQANHDPQIMGVSDALGAGYAGVFDYSFYFKALMAAADWTDVLQITSVHLHLFVPPGLTASSFPFGKPTNNSGFTLGTLAGPFPDNTKTSFFSANYGTPAYHSSPAPLTAYELDATPSVMQDFNITTAFESMAPTNIKDHNGKPCRNQTNYGWWLQRRKSSHNSSPEIVIASETYPDSDLRPVIVMTYVARPSVASVALTDPPPVITQIEGEFFEGDYLSSGPTELLTWANKEWASCSAATTSGARPYGRPPRRPRRRGSSHRLPKPKQPTSWSRSPFS